MLDTRCGMGMPIRPCSIRLATVAHGKQGRHPFRGKGWQAGEGEENLYCKRRKSFYNTQTDRFVPKRSVFELLVFSF